MTGAPGQKHNLLVFVHTDQPFEGGRYCVLNSMTMEYISAGVLRQYSIRLRADQKTDQGQTSDIVSAVSYIEA